MDIGPHQKPNHHTAVVKRIVTGDGGALGDSEVNESDLRFEETGYSGMSQVCLWKTSETPSNDTNVPADFDGASRVGDRMQGYVCSMGTNFFVQDFAPGAVVPMHCSHTIDYFYMVAGKMISTTPQGDEFTASAGDFVVRRGNMHGWRNPGPDWARWVAVILDAHPAERHGESVTEGMK